ncbi:hypothetical protein ACTFIU_000527 [Dictyostelium citrinum]
MEEQNDFTWAVKNGDIVNVKKSVEAKKDLISITDGNKRGPCHWAADFNQVEVLEYLISKGAKFDNVDDYGITPLLAAVYEGHKGAVELLLKKGANKSVKGPDGQTAYEAAEKAEIKALLK